MLCNGIVMGFNLKEDESLRPIVQAGFSKPVRDEVGKITSEKRGYEHSSLIEVERIQNQAFFTIHPVYGSEEQAVGELLDDLRSVGAIS